MPRLARHWNQRETPRRADQTASALSVNIWRLAGDGLLALENEGFETRDWAQRLDVIGQFAMFGAHLVDREAQQRLPAAARTELVTALVRHLAALMRDNRLECGGGAPPDFIGQFNAASERYARCGWSAADGPGFALRRELGDAVAACMDARGRKWIATYVIDREAPKFDAALRRTLRSLMPPRR